ncbi:Mrx20p KNAG_0D02920 [Huiozyma naganishii CBS 8797]|uniref:Mitochondrial carrier protein n=1 Tax=Huiozyma naganishii (strain ATCC MYA-139 / BCRC 22969 / CBS 8797 / KCTC 17520 / NBRC 10181 / NCYC 3082 / Yp74L-3) TaxID=1071383 RepID=J7S711_HUIN7|nr:hypothetical protein KNAG_0D02920 [Kazachstania naganishii CBS 8797]CCK70041.1 hypothetical protein KNAG_0D02920 [Kazachstania naganishii CBS 8797]
MREKGYKVQILAGSCAALFQTTVSQPFEFLKTGLQLRGVAHPLEGAAQLRTYFTGCSVLNVGAVLKTCLRFQAFDWACALLRDPAAPVASPLVGPRMLLASVLTGTAETVLVVPLESIKTTMIENALRRGETGPPIGSKLPDSGQSKPTFHSARSSGPAIALNDRWAPYDKTPSVGLLANVKEIYATRGVRGYFQGMFPTMWRQIGNSMVRFTTYSVLKQTVTQRGQPINETLAFAMGALSSLAVVTITQPLDVIKTRMQSRHARTEYRNSLNCCYRIFVQEGITTFWKGAVPRLFKVALSGGISFGIYEYVENLVYGFQNEGFLK